MKFNINYIAIFSYLFLAVAYLIFISNNLDKNNLLTFGSFVILFGYLISLYERIDDQAEIDIQEYLESIKKINQKNKIVSNNENNIIFSHLFLTIFYIISFILPINQNHQLIDIFVLLGHLFTIKYNQYIIIGLIFLTIYNIINTIRNFDRFNLLFNKLQVIGGLGLILYYGYKSYKNIKNKEKEKTKYII